MLLFSLETPSEGLAGFWRVNARREQRATSGKGGTGEMGGSIMSGKSQLVIFGVRSSETLELLTPTPPLSRPSRQSRAPIQNTRGRKQRNSAILRRLG